MTAAATGTPQASTNKQRQYLPSGKEFSTARARLALLGHTLAEKVHQVTGLHLWEVSRHGQTRVYSHWNDVLARLAQLGG